MSKVFNRNVLVLSVASALVAACGGGGGGGGGGTPPPPTNSAPTITPIGDQTVDERTTAVVSVVASDPDGDNLTFSLTGDDAAAFTLSSGGALSFDEAPDFANPTDANTDNVYNITIGVSDGSLSDSESLTVTVANIVDGRVVDGPVRDASISLQRRAAGTSDPYVEEATTTSGPDGRFDFAGYDFDYVTYEYRTVSTGGIDTTTDVDLGDLTLITKSSASGGDVNINAITTVLSVLESEEDQQALLDSLGIVGSPDDVIQNDIWAGSESGNEDDQAAQRVNAQLVTIIKTTSTVVDNAGGQAVDPATLVTAVAEEIIEASDQTSGTVDLSSGSVVTEVVGGAIQNAAPDADVEEDVIEAAATAASDVNAVLGDENTDPTSETAIAVANAAQDDLQTSVQEVVTGQTTVEQFNEDTAAENLLSEVPTEPDAPDFDEDGVPDAIDPDDDNDGVNDAADAFPFDDTETTDTDGDEIGNNADDDDDGDAVLDVNDAYPLDAAISTTAVEIRRGTVFTITDYNPSSQQETTFTDSFTVSSDTVSIVLDTPLNQQNMQNAADGGDFQAPTVTIPVLAVPTGSDSDSTAVVELFGGNDTTQDASEPFVSVDLELAWTGDGQSLEVTLPAQTATGEYIPAGTSNPVNITLTNAEADFLTINPGSGPETPPTLDLKLTALIAKIAQVLPLEDFLSAGNYTVRVATDGVPIYVSRRDDPAGNKVSTIVMTYSLQ